MHQIPQNTISSQSLSRIVVKILSHKKSITLLRLIAQLYQIQQHTSNFEQKFDNTFIKFQQFQHIIIHQYATHAHNTRFQHIPIDLQNLSTIPQQVENNDKSSAKFFNHGSIRSIQIQKLHTHDPLITQLFLKWIESFQIP